VFFPAADTVGITAGGVEKFRFGSNPIPGGYKNLLINGAATIAQRGAVTGLGASNYVYGLDGWCHYAGYGSAIRYTMEQGDGPGAGFAATSPKSLKIDITTADTSSTANLFSGFIQKMEGQHLQHLQFGNAAAQPLTLSFWAKGTKTGTHCVALYAQDGNRSCPIEWTMASADTWQKVTVTFPGDASATTPPADNTPYLWLVFPLHSGSSYEGTSGSWASGENYATSSTVNIGDSTSNDFYITDVQLEVGSVATDYAREDESAAKMRCYRYYKRITQNFGQPGMPVSSVRSDENQKSGFPLVPPMRAAPSLETSGNADDYNMNHGNGNTVCDGVPSLIGASTVMAGLRYRTDGGVSAGFASQLEFLEGSGSGFLAFNAEL
jgi:hypothetical protein